MNLKQTLLTLSLGIISSNTFAQLPVVQAKGGEGTNITWSDIKKQVESEGNYFFDSNCAQGLSPEHASSTLKGQASKAYGINNLSDNNPMTAWVEGVEGYGIGEWFEVKGITVNAIYNGYQSSPENWKNNSRVKRFKVYMDGHPICFLDLTDEMGVQRFELPHHTNWEDKLNFKFEIVEVYQGDKWADVCISHIDHVACCFAPNTLIYLNNRSENISTIQEGTEVLCLDLDKGNTFYSTIKATAQQRHLSLLEITTADHQIAITPDHPLYIKDKGFVSLSQLLSKMEANKDWDDLVGLEVLVFDNATQKTHYQAIKSIQKTIGDFNTFSILSIDKAKTYIANGFVSKTY
jgi:hypothetical protein